MRTTFGDFVYAALMSTRPISGDDRIALLEGDLCAAIRICAAMEPITAMAYGVDREGLSKSQIRGLAELQGLGIKFQAYSVKTHQIIAKQKSRAEVWESYEAARAIVIELCRQLCPVLAVRYEAVLGA